MPKIIPEYNVRYESERQRLYREVAEQSEKQLDIWTKEYGRSRALVLYKRLKVTINYPSRHKRGQEFSSYRQFVDLENFENFLKSEGILGPSGGPSGPNWSPYELMTIEEYQSLKEEKKSAEIIESSQGKQYVKFQSKKPYIGQEELEITLSIEDRMGKKIKGITKYWKGKIINEK